MEVLKRVVRLYRDPGGKYPFNDWAHSLKDLKVKSAITARMMRAMTGNFGDFKYVGYGVWELRIHLSPGYRIYFGLHENLAIVLAGGTKDTQSKDIKNAVRIWRNYLEHEK